MYKINILDAEETGSFALIIVISLFIYIVSYYNDHTLK